jgi:hypothetical protein
MILNNKNEVYVIERLNPANFTVIKIIDYLPTKQKNVSFNKLNYFLFKEKGYIRTYITLTD